VQLRAEQREPVVQVALAVGSDHCGEITGIPQGREAGGRQQVLLKILELARPRYPDVAGA